MTCDDARPLLDAYIDTELDLASSLSIERHLSECAACSGVAGNLDRLRAELTPDVFNQLQPDDLARARASFLQLTGSLKHAPPLAKSRWTHFGAWAAAAAALAAVFVFFPRTPDAVDAVNRQLVDSHVRSLMAEHLVDVPSSDRHTVRPWFQGKLDFAPDVPNLESQGFPIVGGRLDVLNGKPAAAVVYKRRGHPINSWTARTGAADASPSFATLDGYQIAHWIAGGLEHWAASDLNRAELEVFTALLRHAN